MSPYFTLLTVLGIGFLIFIHEAGHYLCARFVGVRVLVFSLGFGPRLFGFIRGGTDYRISAVPLGGYVRVAGEDPTDRRHAPPDGLHAKGVPARALFFLGGVAMNLLFALVAFPIVFKAGVLFSAPLVGDVAIGSPAWERGLEPGDRVLEVDGKSMYSFDNMQVEIALSGGRDVTLLLQRGERVFEETVQPRFDDSVGLYAIGIGQPILPSITVAVLPDTPAYHSGLRSGDQLVALNGAPVTPESVDEFEARTRYRRESVTLEVIRGDADRRTFTFTPGLVELTEPEVGVFPPRRRVAGLREGLAPLARLGLRRGDHVLEVDGRPFPGGSFAEFAAGPDELTMLVHRDGVAEPVPLRATFSAADRRALDQKVGLAMDRVQVAVVPRPGSPAEAAGIAAGDVILSARGHRLESWEDLRATVQATPAGGALPVLVATAGGTAERSLHPATQRVELGFRGELTPLREPYRQDTIGGAIRAGLVSSIDLIKQLYVTLKNLFTGDVAAKNLGGIITISRVTYLFAQSGWERFLYFLAVLSINLAVINLLPIPVLDGGHLLFVVIEGIKGSPVSPKVLNYSQILGLVFIVALLVFVTYNDILRLL